MYVSVCVCARARVCVCVARFVDFLDDVSESPYLDLDILFNPIHIYICVCVCLSICVCARVCWSLDLSIDPYLDILFNPIHIHMCVCVCVCARACMCFCRSLFFAFLTSVSESPYLYLDILFNRSIYICICVCLCLCVSVCARARLLIYRSIYRSISRCCGGVRSCTQSCILWISRCVSVCFASSTFLTNVSESPLGRSMSTNTATLSSSSSSSSHVIQLTPQQQSAEPRNSAGAEALAVYNALEKYHLIAVLGPFSCFANWIVIRLII